MTQPTDELQCHDQRPNPAIKSYFLGPKAENASWVLDELMRLFVHFFRWRQNRFPDDPQIISVHDQLEADFLRTKRLFQQYLGKLMELYEGEVPKFTQRYIGHMVSEISLPALFGNFLNLLHNPNLACRDTSRVASVIEREAIEALLDMVGFGSQQGCGHFTSGGTIANIEAMWRARYRLDHWLSLAAYLNLHKKTKMSLFSAAHMGWQQYFDLLKTYGVDEQQTKPYSFVVQSAWSIKALYDEAFSVDFAGPLVLVPGNKHYSWQKAASLLGLGDANFHTIALDEEGRLSVRDLEHKMNQAQQQNRPIVMVVSVAGTTELGEFDPVHEIQDLLDKKQEQENIHVWHHVDAAYGGFYASILQRNGPPSHMKWPEAITNTVQAFARVDSLTIDPHKLGYVPYACGALVLRTQQHDQVSSFAAPYLTYQEDRDLWTTTLEGSRSANGAVATWLTAKSMGFTEDGLGQILREGICARRRLHRLLEGRGHVLCVDPSDSNIFCFAIACQGMALSQVNDMTRKLFDAVKHSPDYSVSKTELSFEYYEALLNRLLKKQHIRVDTDHLFLVRMVLMNPFLNFEIEKKDFLNDFVEQYVDPFINEAINMAKQT